MGQIPEVSLVDSVHRFEDDCLCVQMKRKLLLRVCEFNACIPYSGVTPAATLPEMSVHSIFGLLPDPAPENAPPPTVQIATQVGRGVSS